MDIKKICLSFFILFVFSFTLCARDITFFTLSGKEISYQELERIPKALLFIWTTWCPHCRQELDKLRQESIFFEGVDVFYVNAAESRTKVEKYADYKDFSSKARERTLLDEDAYLVRRFSISAVPTYVFLENGKVVGKTYFLTEKLLNQVFGDD